MWIWLVICFGLIATSLWCWKQEWNIVTAVLLYFSTLFSALFLLYLWLVPEAKIVIGGISPFVLVAFLLVVFLLMAFFLRVVLRLYNEMDTLVSAESELRRQNQELDKETSQLSEALRDLQIRYTDLS